MTDIEVLAREIRGFVPTDLVPEGDVDALFLLYALLGTVKGADVTSRDVHDAWRVWMRLTGADHPSLVPFDELPPHIKAEDAPFAEAIRRAVRRGEPR